MVLIVMGVSGCGKTTVGRLLADQLGCRFLDADDFHPTENVAKMRAAIPLTDEDRAGWLARLRREIERHLTDNSDLVLACSALRESYRQKLSLSGEAVRFVYLRGTREAIFERLSARQGHYMPAGLLDSQFAVLEEPAQALIVPVDLTPAAAVARIMQSLD